MFRLFIPGYISSAEGTKTASHFVASSICPSLSSVRGYLAKSSWGPNCVGLTKTEAVTRPGTGGSVGKFPPPAPATHALHAAPPSSAQTRTAAPTRLVGASRGIRESCEESSYLYFSVSSLRRHLSQDIRGPSPRARVNNIGRDFNQRLQHKACRRHMRGCGTVIRSVEITRSPNKSKSRSIVRGVQTAGGPLAPQLPLNGKKILH